MGVGARRGRREKSQTSESEMGAVRDPGFEVEIGESFEILRSGVDDVRPESADLVGGTKSGLCVSDWISGPVGIFKARGRSSRSCCQVLMSQVQDLARETVPLRTSAYVPRCMRTSDQAQTHHAIDMAI